MKSIKTSIKYSILSIVIAICSGYVYGDITSNLKLRLKLDEGFGTFAGDATGNGNNGVLLNAPSWVAGKIGTNALVFNGSSSYINLGSNTIEVAAGANITVSAWVKTTDFYGPIVSLRSIVDNPIVELAIGHNGDPANVSAGRFVPLTRTTGGMTEIVTSPNISDGNWHFVALVLNQGNSTLTAYVDGTAFSTALNGTGSMTFETYIGVGAELVWKAAGYLDSDRQHLNGTIDDVRIYSRALSSPDIAELFNFTEGPARPVISDLTTKTGTVGMLFTSNIVASNSPTSYSRAGALPPGLELDTVTGAIQGTPMGGSGSFTVTATNGGGTSDAVPFTITISPAGPAAPVITSASSADGVVGTPFSYTIQAAGNPTTFGVTGSLPSWLSLGSSAPVNDTEDGSISYSGGNWGYAPQRQSYANYPQTDLAEDVHYTVVNGGFATFTFTGTTIQFLSETYSDEGIVDVYIDGEFKQSVNCYSASRLCRQVVYTNSNLTPGSHTIKVVKMSGSYMLVDGFVSGSPNVISGIPTSSGSVGVTLSATNANGVNFAPLTITINPVVAQPPTLLLLVGGGGDNQTAPPGQFNSQPFDIAVLNAGGPLPNTNVTFTVQSGGGLLASVNTGNPALSSVLNLFSDQDGTVQVYYQQPGTSGTISHIRVNSGLAELVLTATSAGSPADADGNGLPDLWERRYFPNAGVDPNADPDGDGMSTRDEWFNGRNPTERLDAFSLPANVQLVLRTPIPGFFGVKTSDWSIAPVASP